MTKEYWITNSRFKLIVGILILFWIGIMVLLYLKADEVTHNPCEVCAKKIGVSVICTATGGNISMIYNPDMTTQISKINYSQIIFP